MKKYFIYEDGKGTYFLAKTKKCKHLGKLVGEFKGEFTEEPVTIKESFTEGLVVSLINDEKVVLKSFEFYDDDKETCESCEKKFPLEIMESDSEGNWFCPECWKELVPVMKSEYEELVAKGEID